MSGEQILVLLLLVGAFAIGWVARGREPGAEGDGDGEPGAADLDEPIADGERALEAAVTAYQAAAGVAGAPDAADVAADILAERLADLEGAAERVRERLGAEHPLAGDLSQSYDALSFGVDALRSGADAGTLDPFVSVARDARARYRHAARAIRELPP